MASAFVEAMLRRPAGWFLLVLLLFASSGEAHANGGRTRSSGRQKRVRPSGSVFRPAMRRTRAERYQLSPIEFACAAPVETPAARFEAEIHRLLQRLAERGPRASLDAGRSARAAFADLQRLERERAMTIGGGIERTVRMRGGRTWIAEYTRVDPYGGSEVVAMVRIDKSVRGKDVLVVRNYPGPGRIWKPSAGVTGTVIWDRRKGRNQLTVSREGGGHDREFLSERSRPGGRVIGVRPRPGLRPHRYRVNAAGDRVPIRGRR